MQSLGKEASVMKEKVMKEKGVEATPVEATPVNYMEIPYTLSSGTDTYVLKARIVFDDEANTRIFACKEIKTRALQDRVRINKLDSDERRKAKQVTLMGYLKEYEENGYFIVKTSDFSPTIHGLAKPKVKPEVIVLAGLEGIKTLEDLSPEQRAIFDKMVGLKLPE